MLPVREQAAALVTDRLVIVGVRHHSPACALQVRRVIAERRPCEVLVEGPRSFTPLIDQLTHPDAVTPLALYTYASDTTRHAAAYYPFCDYSPELVALREAARQGIPAGFIDLDFTEQVSSGRRNEPSLLEERRYAHSEGLDRLAATLGCRDHEDLWELLFEADAHRTSLPDFVAAMTAYCGQARADSTPGELDADGTTAREAEMAWHIEQALSRRGDGDGPVLVVVGGFHAVALPGLLADPPARPAIKTKFRNEGSALIRYSFERLERLNGYAAGMTSPAWHQRQWEALLAGDESPRLNATVTALLDISDTLRNTNQAVAQPTVAAAFESALLLANLRNHPAPLRTDVVDAVTSTFVKGTVDLEGAGVLGAVRTVLTGQRIGVTPPGAATPPLVTDTLERLKKQRLSVDAPQPRSVHLDIYRREAHRETSRLLHGLALLEVTFAQRTGGPDYVHGRDLNRLQERWDYRWLPDTEGGLAEAALYGVTLPEAVSRRFEELTTQFAESTAQRDAQAACSLLIRACVLGLHAQASELLPAVVHAVGEDPSFTGLARACSQLALLRESREALETRRLKELPDLLTVAYRRAIYLGNHSTGADAADVTEALVRLRELLASDAGSGLDADAYWRLIGQLRITHPAAMVRGSTLGLQYTTGRLRAADVATAAAGHLAGTVAPAEAIGFLHGLLQTAREIIWQEPVLVDKLGEQLDRWDEATFLAHLPDLRLAFADLTPSETDQVASVVARRHDGADVGSLTHRDVVEADVAANLEASHDVAQLLARDGLDTWAGAL